MKQKLAMMVLILSVAAAGLSACGKRGDPYRPSEIPEKAAPAA